jgi:hypothetical protein
MTRAPRGRYVYALVSGDARPIAVRGIGGRRLTRIRVGGVSAIVEPMHAAPTPTADRLERQDRIVRRLAAVHPSIVPARFGSFLRDEAELRVLVRARGRTFARALARVRGREQMVVRVFCSQAAAALGQAGRTRAQPGSGVAYLERRAAAFSAGRVPAVARIRRALGTAVRGERVEIHEGPDPVVSVYHLVRRGAAEAYCAKIFEAISAESGVAAVVTGPWPPYAFAPEMLES